MWLRKFEYLDEKWLKCNLNGALKDPYTRSAIFNTLIQDNELSDTKFHLAVNSSGRNSYLRSDGKYYCGGKVLTCSCCEGVCGPTSSCVCDACQLVPASLELGDDVLQNHHEKINDNTATSESCFESWMWGPIPDDNQLNTCIKKLLCEQRKICLQASDNSLSSFSLKMILKIYERYFAALSRSKSKNITASNRESLFNDKNPSFDIETKETSLTPSEKAKMELAKLGSRTALNFFFASLKRAWKSGDTELCSELLSDSLEAIQMSLEPGALFDTSSLSTLWLEAIEKSIKFLRQIVLSDITSESEAGGTQHQIPRADRNISMNLLLELEMQKGTLAGSLEGVLLLLTVSEMSTNQSDNRQPPQIW